MIKLVTIMFADVVGSTAQAEQMHPDETRALMAEFFEAMSEEIRAEGGTIERIIGDAIMADFGVPIAREGDPIQALRAGRRMLARLEHWNEDRPDSHRIRIRIGINTGNVSTGGSYGEQLMVMGDAVNVAARLQQAAEPNTILIGERTAQAVRDHFELHEVEPLEMKGKTGKVAAFLVAGERRPEPRTATPFVGRAAELKALRDVLERARLKRAGVVATIVGEPGAGKSRLIAELVAAIAPEAKVVEGVCSPFGQNAALRPFRDILRIEVGIAVTDPPEVELEKIRERLATLTLDPSLDPEQVTAALGATFGVKAALDRFAGLDPREIQRELVSAWQGFLEALAAEVPIVVVVEDVQWADQGTLGLIGELSKRVRVPLAFLCATRPDLLEEQSEWIASLDDHASIRLHPLDKDESAALVSSLLEDPDLPGPLLDEMLGKAEGNPFFLEEIIRRLIDLGQLEQRDGRWLLSGDTAPIEIPDNVRLAILSRIDLLPQEHRQVLQGAAVVGRVFWSGAVRKLTALPEVDDLLETLRQRRFIVERFPSAVPGEPEYSFLHTLIRDVAYEGLPVRNRGQAHAAAAAWVEEVRGEAAEESAELLAYHYERAFEALNDDTARSAARRYSIVAARGALRRFAIQQAETFGRRAVDLSTPGQERVMALETLGDMYMLTFKSDGVWNAYTEAMAEIETMHPPDKSKLSKLAGKASIVPTRWRGTMHDLPSQDQVASMIQRGLDSSPEGDTPEKALLLASKAILEGTWSPSGGEGAHDLALEAMRIAEGLGDPDLTSLGIDAAVGSLISQGRWDEIDRLNQRRVELIPRLSDVREICDAYAMAAFSSFYLGNYGPASEHAAACVRRSFGIDAGSYLQGLVWQVSALFMLGEWDAALSAQSELERLQQEEASDLPGALAMRAYAFTAFCRELRGETEIADRYFQLLRRSQTETPGLTTAGYLPTFARALVHRGDADEARQLLEEKSIAYPIRLEALCEVVAAHQDWQSAPEIVAGAREECSRNRFLALSCFADRLEGRLLASRGDFGPAAEVLRRSVEGFARIEAAWEEAFSRLFLGEVLSFLGQHNSARDHLDSCLATFERLGSVAERARASKLLAEVER